MLKKILTTIGSVFFLCLLSLNQENAYAAYIIGNDGKFQEIKLDKDDYNHWIQVSDKFTSVAIKSEKKAKLGIVFDPYTPVEKEVIFDDDEYSELIFTNPTKNFLITAKGYPLPESIEVYLFDTREKASSVKSFAVGNTDLNGLRIISRSQWGADENLRYYEPDENDSDSSGSAYLTAACKKKVETYPEEYKYEKTISTEEGNHLTWPLQYSPEIKKIVVHHTGETKVTNERPSDEMMRAIYYYHTIVKGWGDIGYHYVVGKDGEIYEGKAGGDKVVGAHVYCSNIGTVGVSVMGNFNLQKPTTKQLNSLKAILAKLSQKHKIKPEGRSSFHGESLPNILGHKDLGPTACPGENLYSQLPQIRKEVAKGFTYKFSETTTTSSKKDYEAEVTKKVEVLKLAPTHQEKLIFSFKNTGKQTWNDTTWLHVSLNSNTNAWAETVVPDKKYVAADMRESSVRPGKTGTFEVTINAGYNPGFYILEFAPVVNNKYKLSSSAILQPIEIPEANYNYDFVKAGHPPNPFYAEQPAEAWIELKNTGNIVWRNYGDNKIYLGTTKPQDRKSLFSTDGRRNRLGYLKEREVFPGQTGHFVMPLTAPERRGIYRESFAPVIEGVKWLEDKGMQFRIIVKEPKHQIKFTTKSNLLNLNPDTQRSFTVTYQNLSDVTWTEDQIYFMLAGDYRKLGIEENTFSLSEPLLKGKKGSFKIEIKTPLQRGLYKLTVVPVIRGKKFENASPFTLRIIVKKPTASGEVLSNLPKTINLDVNESKTLQIKIRNKGNFTWTQENTSLVPLSQKSRMYVEDKWISRQIVSYLEEDSVSPGKTGTFKLYLNPKYRGYFTDVFKVNVEEVGHLNNVLIPLRIKSGQISSRSSSAEKTSNQTTQNNSKQTNNNSSNASNSQKEQTDSVEKKSVENPIRVRLSVPDQNSVEITADQNYTIIEDSQKRLFSVSRGEKALVKKVGKYMHVQVGSTNKVASVVRFIPNGEGIMEISSWENRPAWNKKLNDNRFRGIIETREVDGQLAVINELSLEDYLKGIAEVSNSDPVEKLKTLAVLSRTYALFYLQPENEKFPGKPYDASDDPDVFQKYLGYGLEQRSPNFTKATQATQNEVVTYQGKLVKTPYFNQSSGRTLSAEEVWGWKNTPYLVSVDDPDCIGLQRKGHGVGLSGYGATKRAMRGHDYKEIIKYYYKNVEVEKL